MSLLHSCLVVRVRRPLEGEPAHLTLVESGNVSGEGTASAPVVEAYHELMSSGPEAVEARRHYSHCVLIVDNGLRASHEFPDLEAAAVQREHDEAVQAATAETRKAEKSAASLRRQLAEAEARQSAAEARLADLTGVPGEPEPDSDPDSTTEERRGADETDPQGGTLPPAPPTGSAEDNPAASAPSGGGNPPADSEPDPVAKMAARLEAGETVAAEDLATLTVPQLKALAARYDIAIPPDAKKDDIVALLLPPAG